VAGIRLKLDQVIDDAAVYYLNGGEIGRTHAFKRSKPLRDGKVAEDGIVFMGDGAWGVAERAVHTADTWYLEKSQAVRHGMIVTLTKSSKKVTTINHRGEVIDEVVISVRSVR
jgi:hypothetical protein